MIVAGHEDRLKPKARTVTLPVKRFHIPRDYMKNTTNNIAILEMTTFWPLTNPDIGVINLPTSGPQMDMEFLVPGWGRLYRVS